MTKKKTSKKDLEKIEKFQKKELAELKKVSGKEERVESEIENFEKELESLKKEVTPDVVEKITLRDLARGIVGSIFGMSIMGWHEGVRQAAITMPVANVAIIVILTIIAGSSVLYFSQYKRIREAWIIKKLLPKRFVLFYLLSLGIVLLIYTVFNIIKIGVTSPQEIIRLVLVLGLPAMIGASTADIIT